MFRSRALCQMKPCPDKLVINPHRTSLPLDYFKEFPEYQGKSKEFPSRTKKPLQISTKGYLMNKIDKKYVEEIQPKEQMIEIEKLLLQFKEKTQNKQLANDVMALLKMISLSSKENLEIIAKSNINEIMRNS